MQQATDSFTMRIAPADKKLLGRLAKAYGRRSKADLILTLAREADERLKTQQRAQDRAAAGQAVTMVTGAQA